MLQKCVNRASIVRGRIIFCFFTWRLGSAPWTNTSCNSNVPGAREFENRAGGQRRSGIDWVSAGPVATGPIAVLLLLLPDRLAARRRLSPVLGGWMGESAVGWAGNQHVVPGQASEE